MRAFSSLKVPLPKRPSLFDKSVRKTSLKVIGEALLITVIITAIMALNIGFYLGATWNPFHYFSNLQVAIINLDNQTYGYFIQHSLTNTSLFAWRVDPNIDAHEYIQSYSGWFAITIPENFTQKLNDSIYNGAHYVDNSIILTYDAGRNFIGAQYAGSTLNVTIADINRKFQYMMFTTLHVDVTKVDPHVIIKPIPETADIINPIVNYGSVVAGSYIIFFIIIMANASVSNLLRIYNTQLNKVNPHQLLIARLLHSLLNTFLMSLFMTVIIFSLGAYVKAGFFVYWMYLWLVVNAFSSIISIMNATLGPYTTLAFLAFVVISYAGSGGAVPLELSPGFFHYGIVLPLYHAINAGRYVTLGSGILPGLSIGVLFIYWITLLSLTIAFYYFNLWRAIRKVKKESVDNKREKWVVIVHDIYNPYGQEIDGVPPVKNSSLFEDRQAVHGMREFLQSSSS